jgi:adenylate cyclase
LPKPVLPKPVVTKPAVTKQPEPALPVEAAAWSAPEVFEATVLVCDLADKYDLLDSSEPATATRNLAKFSQRASELLLQAGAHLHKADGEGVVALFGYPKPEPGHAEKAVCAAIDLIRAFSSEAHGSNGDSVSEGGAHIGISSGDIIAGRSEGVRDLFVLGEAVELARRFCVANRFYGSRILIGPQTFEMASSAVVARPIDFLTGVTSQERHEIYEPLALAADAPAELLARRDSFWNGVVLYREKRWVEALSEFQKARVGAPDEEDPPLNLYLRRLEPLALHFLESGRE